MTALTVWRFADADGAAGAVQLLETRARDETLVVLDAAVVAWEAGSRKPRARPLAGSVTSSALGAGFWGLLFGLVFSVPLLGAAIGAATGALADALADVGIDDHFINRVRDEVTPGTSALFLLTSDAVVGLVRDALADGPRPELIATHLEADQEAALRAVFGE
jgi:uncharacterized membrane protein